MKRSDRSKALALTRKASAGAFAPTAAAPGISSRQHLLARRGLWQLLCFLLLSMATWVAGDRDLFGALPAALITWLGAPPPLALIDLAFGIYLLSALILLPGRFAGGNNDTQSWTQLLYRASFYFIYLASAAMTERFVIVLAGGLVLYGLEQLYFWGMTLWGGDETEHSAEEE